MSVFATVSRFLPPPTYMTLPSVGVDISDTSMKYVQFRRNRSHGRTLELVRWGDVEIPERTLSRGNVNDAAALSAALGEVRRRTQAEFIRVSLPEERAYLFETQVKLGTPFNEIRGMLEFRLEENVPISPRDALFDYEILDSRLVEDELRVSVTVYARDTILGYYDAALAAGLTPLSFEVEAQAIARAALPQPSIGTHLIVDFGKTRTGIGIVHQNALMYTSTIDSGGNELSRALRQQFGDITEAESTVIKNTQGLVRGATDTAAYDALIGPVGNIKDELALRIQYWNSHEGSADGRQIESIILCGGSANLKGLPGYLAESLGIETRRGDVWQNAFSIETRVPPIERQHSYGYATAIGLALAQFL